MKETSAEKYAEEAKQNMINLTNFGYHGEIDLIRSFNKEGKWAFSSFSLWSADDDLVSKSNWEVISEDLTERFPDLCEIMSSSVWAGCTHVEQLLIKLFDDDGKITPVVEACAQWHDKLSNYPIADEAHYSELQFERESAWSENSITWEMERLNLTEDATFEKVLTWLHQQANYGEEGWYEKEDIVEACDALGFLLEEF